MDAPPDGTWTENRAEQPGGLEPFRELWRSRELVGFFALRDLRVRYKQALLGAAWVVLQPLVTVVVFTMVFNRLAGVDTGGLPYPVFALSGLLSWTYFSSTAGRASDVLVGNASLITKVYFPRLTAPVAGLLPPLVDLAVGLGALLVLCVVYGVGPGWRLLGAPLWLLLLVATTLGLGLWLSALNVRYRDVRSAVVPLLQVMLFVSPVAYPVELVPDDLRVLYALNPLVGVLGLGRWALVGAPWPGLPLAVSTVVAVLLLVSGAWYFQRAERSFADVI